MIELNGNSRELLKCDLVFEPFMLRGNLFRANELLLMGAGELLSNLVGVESEYYLSMWYKLVRY